LWKYDLLSGTFTTVLDLNTTPLAQPGSQLAMNRSGDFFGTAALANKYSCGVIYEFEKSHGYRPEILYQFTGVNGDGCDPFGRLALDKDGNMLGTTYAGGTNGDGTVYKLDHQHRETILHTFNLSDGWRPQAGLTEGPEGTWFSTTASGGSAGEGTVF